MKANKEDEGNEEETKETKEYETGYFRRNLSEILESVKHHELGRVRISRHKKVQASVIPDEHADMIYDLTEEELKDMHEAIGSFLKLKRKSSKGGKLVHLKDVLNIKRK